MHITLSHKMIAYTLIIAVLIPFMVLINTRSTSYNQDIIVPIIMYHEVKPNPGDYSITPDDFESDLRYIKEQGFVTITMDDLINYVYNGAPLPKKSIVLTFDDGYYNNYVYAYPLIEKYRMNMVVSVIGIYTDQASKGQNQKIDDSHVTWDQISEMVKSGRVEIENHTYNMHDITQSRKGCKKRDGESTANYEEALRDDINTFQLKMIEKTGVAPNTFTYPHGIISQESVNILKKLGFKASLTSNQGYNIITRDKNCITLLKRYDRYHTITLAEIIRRMKRQEEYDHEHNS